MSVFCLLWPFLFYLFWRSVSWNSNLGGSVIAVLAGCAVALFQLFYGLFFYPGEFGFSRWLSGFVDIVALPALLPFIIYPLLVGLKIISGPPDFANFTQLWLIPCAVIRALAWSSQNDPIILILVPILWTAIAVGISFFIGVILNGQKLKAVLACLGIPMIPLAAATSYWAFFSQKSIFGFLFLFAALIPMTVSVALSFSQAK